MRGDFGTFDFTEMTDDEIYDLVVQHLGEYPELDLGWIDVAVRSGHVTLSGSVSSDGEVQIAEKALLDVLGLSQESFTNELVVDELHRGEHSEAADDAVTEELEADDQLGSPNLNQSDTAEHLVEDLDALSYGTHDVGAAVQEGASYEPPDRPVPDGYGSREAH
ncbi:MAG TPA: BON domain-containing protein [Longimicrobiaceae bacterium]|nr:BON domain-containing protein [Longimicrobiaceae bacterium]